MVPICHGTNPFVKTFVFHKGNFVKYVLVILKFFLYLSKYTKVQ